MNRHAILRRAIGTFGFDAVPAIALGISAGAALMPVTARGQIFVVNSEVTAQNGLASIGEYSLTGTAINPSLVSGLAQPVDIATNGSDLFVTDPSADTISEYDTSGNKVSPFPVSTTTPLGVVVSGSDLFVANANGTNGFISEYSTSGTPLNSSLISGLNGVFGIAVSGSNLFEVNTNTGTVGEYTTAGAVVNASLITGLNDSPIAIAASGSDLYIVNNTTGTVSEYTLGSTPGTISSTIPSLISGLVQPHGIAVSGSDLYVTSGANGTETLDTNGVVGEYTTSGQTVNASLITGFSDPYGIVVLGASGPAANLTWNNSGGTGDGMTWDTTNQNWNNGSGPAVYTDGSAVTFNDANNGNYSVTLSATVSPGSVVVNNSSGNYTLLGEGAGGTPGIAGTCSLTKSGSGTLFLDCYNSYTGATTIEGGTVVLAGHDGALQSDLVAVDGGTLDIGLGTFFTVGTVSVQGDGVVIQTGQSEVASIGELDLGGTGSGNYTLSDAPLSTVSVYIGGSSAGAGTEQGTLTVNDTASLNVGTLTLYNSAGNTLTLNDGIVHSSTINQFGGTFTNNGALAVGESVGSFGASAGTYNLSGGTSNAASVSIGGSGSFDWTGGAFTTGTIAQSGGTFTDTSPLTLAGAGGVAVAYNLGGGAASASAITISSGGTFDWTAGTLTTGAITQSGGSFTVTEAMLLAGTNGNAVSYSLSGGTLTTGPMTVGADGTLTISGGSISTGNLNVASGGALATLDYTGGSFTTAIITAENCLFRATEGGTITCTTANFDAGAIVSLDGGTTLSATAVYMAGGNVIVGNATLSSSGAFSVGTGSELQLVNPGSSIIQSSSTVSNSGLIYGSGQITSAIQNNSTGEISVSSGQSLTINGATNSNGGLVSLAGGILQFTGALTNTGFVEGAGTLRVDGGLTNNGTLALAGSSSVFGPVTNSASGAIHLSGNSPNVFFGAVANSGLLTIDAGASGEFYGGYTGSGSITDNGSLFVNANTVSGAITGNGNLTIGSVSSGPAVLQLIPGSAPSSEAGLTLTPASKLDLTNNRMFINYGGGPDPIASIAAMIASGYAGGTWNGSGIMSSTAALNSGSYGIGYADAADPGNPADLSSGQIEIMYTLLGDANLDGKVNGADFTILASNFNQGGKSWDQGDFNYDGNVNGADFTLLASNFNQSATQSGVGADDLAALEEFAAANGISLANVPEPMSAGMMVMAGSAILHRRRRACR